MSKVNNVSPAKFKSGSLTDRPYYMPQIKENSQKQFHASPLIRKRYGPFKNDESELSTFIDSNKSTMIKDSHLKVSDTGSQAYSMLKETRLTRLKDPGNLRKSIKDNDYINEVLGNSMSDISHFRQIFIAPKEKLLKAARDETSQIDMSTSKMFENPPPKAHEESPAKVMSSPLRTINPRRSAPRLFANSNSAIKLKDLGMPRNRSIENSSEHSKEDNLSKILSPGALYINQDKEEISRAHAQETVSEKKRVPKERKIFEYQVKVMKFFVKKLITEKVQLPKLYGQTQPTMQEQDDGPSLYKSKTIHSPRMNLKDFEMKQRSEIKTNLEDALKESYLSYEIGTIHEDKKEFKKAILAFEKFLQASQNNSDKIGIVIALNRLGINYQHLRDYRKSLENHLQTLEFSTQPDYFAAYYNIAIALRKLHNFSQALVYLQKALNWTKEFKDLESECITQGQIGVTYLEMGNPQMAKEAFQECYDLTIELKHFKLQLDCLVTLSKILRSFKSSESNVKKELWEIYNQAYFCSKKLEKTRVAEICLCNIGVLESSQNFSAHMKAFNFDNISSQIYN